MTYVVTESCIKCKYTDCVDVCPVDCFREGPNMLVIDPDECIDCTLCVPECPVDAIFAEDDVPDAKRGYVGFIEELPGVNSHGRTLDEARATLQRLAAVVFDEERREAEELIAGKDVVRESFFVPIPRAA